MCRSKASAAASWSCGTSRPSSGLASEVHKGEVCSECTFSRSGAHAARPNSNQFCRPVGTRRCVVARQFRRGQAAASEVEAARWALWRVTPQQLRMVMEYVGVAIVCRGRSWAYLQQAGPLGLGLAVAHFHTVPPLAVIAAGAARAQRPSREQDLCLAPPDAGIRQARRRVLAISLDFNAQRPQCKPSPVDTRPQIWSNSARLWLAPPKIWFNRFSLGSQQDHILRTPSTSAHPLHWRLTPQASAHLQWWTHARDWSNLPHIWSKLPQM